jgi:iron complex outermembrane receptor protein
MNTNTQILIEGQSVGAFYGYKLRGIKDGNWYFSTPSGGTVDTSTATEAYRQVIGNAQPWFTFGWNNSVRWKNLDASIFFRGVVGNKILNLTRWAYGPMANVSDNIFMKDVSKKKTIHTNKALFSDYYLEDGSYVKLDNVTVGYTFKLKDESLVDNLRIYLTGQNLLTITKYSGLDPEINTTSVWNAGIDYCDFYPTIATVMFGVTVSFK